MQLMDCNIDEFTGWLFLFPTKKKVLLPFTEIFIESTSHMTVIHAEGGSKVYQSGNVEACLLDAINGGLIKCTSEN